MSRKLLEYPENLPSGCFDKSNPLWFPAVSEICHNMRKDEIEQHMQFFAAGAPVKDFDPRIASVGVVNLSGVAFFGVDDAGHPYCAGGYYPDESVPGVWKSWMIGTEDGWNRHWRDITRATRWVIGKLLEGGARRLETNCISSRTDAQSWYTDFLGMKFDGELRAYCPNGEGLRMYSITQQDWAERWGGDDGQQ